MAEKGEPVSADDWLYRRVIPGTKFIDKLGNATSRAFTLREQDNGELSVDAKSLTSVETAVVDKIKFRLFEISHLDVKACGVNAYHDPMPINSAHSIIKGDGFEIGNEVIPGLLARKAKRIKFD